MKLTKIEIFGFKSFYNKTVITPGDGITAIVGPNGCGKSNVADAIRWVMGEQSSKILRGSSMSDVIFNGTAKRKSLSYAEVSLCFDNTDKSMPIEYSEVIIARKLYRSGESEYLLNGKVSRLKDITNLIRQSQMGREGYSIIGQGKVEEFINAKPEERRTLFDEATGIAASKSKRAEAERRLAKTDENLIRYKDILSEIDRNLEPLKEQAESAKKYFSLKEKLKYNEVNYYFHKKNSRDKELEQVRKKISGLKEEIQQKSIALENANSEYQGVLLGMENTDDQIKELREKQLDYSVLKEQEDSKRKLQAQKIEFLNTQKENLLTEISRLEKSMVEENQREIQISQEIQDLLANLENIEKDGGNLQLIHGDLLGKKAEFESALAEFAAREKENIYSSHDLQSEIAKLDFESESIAAQEEELFERSRELEVEIAERTAEKSECEEKGIADKEEAEALKKQRFEEEAKTLEQTQKLAKISESITACDKYIAESTARENMVLELQKSYEGYSVPVKRLLSDADADQGLKSKIEGTIASLVKVPKELEMAINAALQNAFQNVVTKTVQDAKNLIAYLRNRNYGQVTFLPLDTVKPRNLRSDQMSVLKEDGVLGIAVDLVEFDFKYQKAFESLLGAVVVVDDIDSGIAVQKRYNSGFKIVTKLGEIFSTSGSVAGGSAKSSQTSVLSYQNRLESILEERNKAADKKAELQKLEVLLKKQIQSGEGKAREISTKLQGLEIAKAQNIEVLKNAAIREQRLIFEQRGIVQRLEGVNNRLFQIEKEKSRLASISETISKSGEQTFDEMEEYKTNLQNITKEIADVANSIAAKNLEKAKVEGGIDNAKQRRGQAKENLSQIEFLLATCDENVSKIEGEIQQHKAEVFDEIDDAYIENLKGQIASIENSKKILSENLQKLDLQKGYATVEIQKLKGKQESLEKEIEDDSELLLMYEGISDEYGEETLERVIDPEYNPSGAKTQIKKLKGEIFALGNINTQAIEDFETQYARHSEMTSHKEDMEKAQEDLRKVIDGLNLDMNAKFFDEFEKIGENFNRIFSELFGGGKASLKLIENSSGDRLSYGIDIEAEPPGKTLQSMTLLSGGEKALTAIAIIIAIMRARPMPFCVFDEIEAALDDVNCKRFASYINNFADATQFILITHKKSTMEVAQNLFGVTMEEKGLSKLVSVSLSDVG